MCDPWTILAIFSHDGDQVSLRSSLARWLMTRYGEVKTDFGLNLSIQAQFCIMSSMLCVIATPSAANSFVELLGCNVNRFDSGRQRNLSPKRICCACWLALKCADLSSYGAQVIVSLAQVCQPYLIFTFTEGDVDCSTQSSYSFFKFLILRKMD